MKKDKQDLRSYLANLREQILILNLDLIWTFKLIAISYNRQTDNLLKNKSEKWHKRIPILRRKWCYIGSKLSDNQ